MKNKTHTYFRIFLAWRLKHISEKQFIMILSVFIGIMAAFAAIILKTLVHNIEIFIRNINPWVHSGWLYLLLPFLGILLTVLFLKYFIKDDISHGVTKILSSISRSKGYIKLHNIYSSVISCAFTTGFGGSVGMEAPIVYTGAAIGSNASRAFKLNYRQTTLLLGCGSAAAIAAIFKAPIAGLIFALEVLMLDLTMASILPLLIATVTAAIVSSIFLGEQVEFYFSLKDIFIYKDIPFYILLGILCGLISLYFTHVNYFVERRFKKIKSKRKKVILGGLLLGLLIFLFPPLYGEGYITLKALLSGKSVDILNNSILYNFSGQESILILFLSLTLLFKVLATSITTSSGGIGGVFAPSLFMGGLTGYIFSKLVNLSNITHLSETNFALVGMAGLIAGVIHAPLTAIFLIAEITGGYELFIPLILTASLSYITIKYFEPHSLYTKKLAERGELITHHKDQAVLTLLKVEHVIEKNLISVYPQNNLGDLVKIIARSCRNIFPVIDLENNFLGLVPLDNVREIMFQKELYEKVLVKDIMIYPPEIISLNDSMELVMKKFKDTGLWNLPVVDKGTYIGFVSRANVFNAYRKLLIEFSDE